MWVDEDGVRHSAWVPPEVILGEEAVALLQAVPREEADAALADLNVVAMSIEDEAASGAVTGPADLAGVNPDGLEYPPEFPGLAPRQGEVLSQTILRFLSGVPAQWRYEAMEAVYDVLEPPSSDEDDEDDDDSEP